MKKSVKAILWIVGSLTILLAVVLVVFGDTTRLQTEIPPLVPSLKTEALPTLDAPAISTKNLTDDFSRQIAKQIIAKNQAGPENLGGKDWVAVADPEALVAKLIEEATLSFDSKTVYPKIETSRIKILNQTDRAAQEKYFADFTQIILTNLTGLSLNDLSPENTNFSGIVSALKKSSEEFYSLPVPKNLVDFHKREITLLLAEANLFALIRDYQIDPIQALLAAEMIDTVKEQSVALLLEINAYAIKEKLTI